MQLRKTNLKQGEMLCTTTIRIEVTNEKGAATGTGFYYSIDDAGDSYIPVVITNRHVTENRNTVLLVITESDQAGNRLDSYYKYQIEGFGAGVINHPDPEIDLCAITLSPLIEDLQRSGKELYAFYINKNIIPTERDLSQLDAIEDIMMIGYPDGLWDEVNNMPLVRSGITSTHPNINYNGNPEFLIDAPCFGGSSGSPVFYLDKSYKTEIQPGINGHKAFLLGVLKSGPVKYIEGKVALPDTDIKVYSQITINLGHVIKSSCLLELEEAVKRQFNSTSKLS